MRTFLREAVAVAVVALLSSAGCKPAPTGPVRPTLSVESIAPPPGSPSAVGAGWAQGTAWVAWTEKRASGAAVLAARLDGGAFTTPVTISTAAVLAAGGSPQSIAEDGAHRVWVAWPVWSQGGRDVDLVASRSDDGGAHWSAPIPVDREVGGTHEARVTLVERRNGVLAAAWMREVVGPLDRKRDVGVDMASLAKDGTSFEARRPLDPRVCGRGAIGFAPTVDGLLGAWRGLSGWGEADVRAMVLADGAWEPTSLVRDGWKAPACPREGAAVVASGRRALIAWFTGAGGAHVKLAASLDAGRSFGGPLHVDEGDPVGGVALGPMGTGAVAFWIERTPSALSLRARPVSIDGATGPAIPVAPVVSLLDSPSVAKDGDGLLVAWQETAGSMHLARVSPAR